MNDRRAFRQWVRAHHPDFGGGTAEFAEGLRRWQRSGRTQVTVTVVRRRRGPRGLVSRWLERRRRRRARCLR